MADLSETAQLVLGAFALADVHTLSAAAIDEMSKGAIAVNAAESALVELVAAGMAERSSEEAAVNEYRLTRDGIELTLQMQQALANRSGN